MGGASGKGGGTREERLAAQLRANLRRRKQQARAIAKGPTSTECEADAPANPPLAKPAPDG